MITALCVVVAAAVLKFKKFYILTLYYRSYLYPSSAWGGANLPQPWIFAQLYVKLFIRSTPLIWAHPRSFQTVFKVTTSVPRGLIDFLWNAVRGTKMVRFIWTLKWTPKIYSVLIYVPFFLKNCKKWGLSFLGFISDQPPKWPQWYPCNFFCNF